LIEFLLDTDICIQLIRQKNGLIFGRLKRLDVGAAAISAITLAELEYGVVHSRDPERNRIALAQFCTPLPILSFDAAAAGVYGNIRDGLEKLGTPMGSLDMLIAAHALSLSTVLVTNNLREFRRVPGLKVEHWAA
jgi:tRNA(fMet)-specific endonuclease VapC